MEGCPLGALGGFLLLLWGFSWRWWLGGGGGGSIHLELSMVS